MITIKLYAERCLDEATAILPTLLVEAPCKTELHLGLIWLKWVAAIELKWAKKAKIAANESKNK